MTPQTEKTIQIEDTTLTITGAEWLIGDPVSDALSLYTQRAAEKVLVWRTNVMPIDEYTDVKDFQEEQETFTIITPEYPASNGDFTTYYGAIMESAVIGSQVFNQALDVEIRFRVVV